MTRLRAPEKEIKKIKSVTGKVDFINHEWDAYTQELITQLAVSTQQPRLENSGTLEDIELELEKLPVVQDSVRPFKTTPEKPHKIETFLDHPGFDKDRDFIRGRFRKIREHWLNHQELIEVNQELKKQGYTRGIQDFKKKHVNPRNPNQIFYCVEVGECEYG
jgi:hypothetical protein